MMFHSSNCLVESFDLLTPKLSNQLEIFEALLARPEQSLALFELSLLAVLRERFGSLSVAFQLVDEFMVFYKLYLQIVFTFLCFIFFEKLI